MGDRRCCCGCPEIVYDLCAENALDAFFDTTPELVGTWSVDPGIPLDRPCGLKEVDGHGRLIGEQSVGAKWMIATAHFWEAEEGDSYSVIIDWGVYSGTDRKWLEFRVTRVDASNVTLAWYSHENANESLLTECTATANVWPWGPLGDLGDPSYLRACISPITGSDPPMVELFGSWTPGAGTRLTLWHRMSPPADSDDDKYYAGAETTTGHDAYLIYFSHQKIIEGNPDCQCVRTCICLDGGVEVSPPSSLTLTYQGLFGPGEDDCTSLSGITITVELYPCGGDSEWIGYADEGAGCFAPEVGREPMRYILRCGETPEDWVLQITEFNLFPNNKHICTAPWEAGELYLYATEESTCYPFALVFEYGPGDPDADPPELDGSYMGWFEGFPYSFCPDGCFDCGGSQFTGPGEWKHLHWRIIVTETA